MLQLQDAFLDDYIDYIYDITVAYPRNIVDTELRLLTEGCFPEEVHFDVRKHSIDDITRGETNKNHAIDASEWLLDIWKEKEERLKQFYEIDSKFEASGDGFVWDVRLFARRVHILQAIATFLQTDKLAFAHYFAFSVWMSAIALWLYLIYASYWIKIYTLMSIAFFVWGQHAKGGSEFLLMEFFYGHRLFLSPNEAP